MVSNIKLLLPPYKTAKFYPTPKIYSIDTEANKTYTKIIHLELKLTSFCSVFILNKNLFIQIVH